MHSEGLKQLNWIPRSSCFVKMPMTPGMDSDVLLQDQMLAVAVFCRIQCPQRVIKLLH